MKPGKDTKHLGTASEYRGVEVLLVFGEWPYSYLPFWEGKMRQMTRKSVIPIARSIIVVSDYCGEFLADFFNFRQNQLLSFRSECLCSVYVVGQEALAHSEPAGNGRSIQLGMGDK